VDEKNTACDVKIQNDEHALGWCALNYMHTANKYCLLQALGY